jgi:hypothetical protein
VSGTGASPGRARPTLTRSTLRAGCAALAACGCAIACGKEGPPLPPIVRIPAAPVELRAERRGDAVDINLVVPAANTDGTRPADVERVDVYAITAPASITDEQLVKQAMRVGSVDVKAPRDPDETVDPDEPLEDVEAPGGTGLDQGAKASFVERLTPESVKPAEASSRSERPAPVRPLAGAPLGPPVRVYAGVAVSTRGRRGPFSSRTPVPLTAPPPPVSALKARYDETTIELTWNGPSARRPMQEAATGDLLSARLVGLAFPTTAYNVYEVIAPTERDPVPSEVRLTETAVDETRFENKRIEWGVERCFRIRTVQTYDRLTIESDASSDVCVTPVDTFPPKPPANVQVVPSEGAISLIWQRGDESDLIGFVVLRGSPGAEALTAVTPAPIPEAAFTDKVAPGVRYVYAVEAVDKAGNRSAPSARSEEMEAR